MKGILISNVILSQNLTSLTSTDVIYFHRNLVDKQVKNRLELSLLDYAWRTFMVLVYFKPLRKCRYEIRTDTKHLNMKLHILRDKLILATVKYGSSMCIQKHNEHLLSTSFDVMYEFQFQGRCYLLPTAFFS